MRAFYWSKLVLVILDAALCQQDEVSNTNLDIVFLLDQQRTTLTRTYADLEPDVCSLDIHWWTPRLCHQIFDYFENSTNYQMAYDGVKNWMQSFFDKAGSSEARFAVIFGCSNNSGGIMHKFKHGNFEKKIPHLLEDGKTGIKTGCRKNFYWMLNLANDDVFTTAMGHRSYSTAIVIVLSDCVHEKLPPSEVSKTKDEFRSFFQKTKGQVYFICYVEFKGFFRDYYKDEIKQFMNETLEILHTNNQTNRSMIYLDGNDVNIGQRLDELLPKRSRVSSTNCSQTWDCGICSGNGTCFAHCNWTTHSWPTGNGTNCTEQAPMIRNCTCPTTTSRPTEPPSYWLIILGFGILLFILVVLVIAVCCIRAKNNRKKRAKAMAVGVRLGPEKKAEIAVDLSIAQSTRSTLDKGSKVMSVPVIRSKVKSVSMSRSMVKSMSKRGSVVKSLAKTGSVSKPVDENAKSVRKPKGGESKSKATKSVNRKSVKSIGISKKSVGSKSIASKSGMKRKNPAPN